MHAGFRRTILGLFVAALIAAGPHALAEPVDPPAASSDTARSAGQKFAAGRAAYQRGDFRLAGTSFDEAFAILPHYDALWNSAQAWESAGELARAANRYARYLSLAPTNAPDRTQATRALATLAKKLGRIHPVAASSEDARIDGEAAWGDEFYVYPGTHEVTIQRSGSRTAREVSVAAGEDRSVSFASASADAVEQLGARPAPSTPASSTESLPPVRASAGVSPWFVAGGAAATVVGGALTGYFGARAVSQKHDFDRNPSAELLDDGRRNQTLTNVGLGVTVGLAAVTVGLALFFVDWRSPSKPAAWRAPLSSSF